MKKNLAVLVLLVMWSVLSMATLSSAAGTGELPKSQGSSQIDSPNDIVVNVNGAVDDDDEGDPGDMGDGYGIADQPVCYGAMGGFSGVDNSILDEFWLLLMSLVQLAL